MAGFQALLVLKHCSEAHLIIPEPKVQLMLGCSRWNCSAKEATLKVQGKSTWFGPTFCGRTRAVGQRLPVKPTFL
jgi:hypothetical protein